jgi:cyclic dehypoxanthinyl futalosine synthase
LSQRIERLLQGVLAGERLSEKQGVELLRDGHFLELAQAARTVRNRLHPPEQASYTVFQLINYTNVCTIDCSFCSFYEEVESGRGYVLDLEQVCAKVESGLAAGATAVFFQGGVHPNLPLAYYEEMLRQLKRRYGLYLRGFSPVELLHLAAHEGLSVAELVTRLKAAGLDSVPGAGAEVLHERVRQILAPKKTTVEQWIEVMRVCHQAGLYGSANIVFGSIETAEELVAHLERVRALQDQTQGFHSFIPWTFQPQTKRFTIRKVPAHEYLAVLALCRLYLDNIPHLETSVLVLGQQLSAVALHCGADDINSVVLEENVLRSYGLRTEDEARTFLRSAGFQPVKRSLDYAARTPV